MIDREDVAIFLFWAPRVAFWVLSILAMLGLGYWLGHLGGW